MKNLTLAILFLVLGGITTSYAQTDANKMTSTYNKVKGQYDKLVKKWQPYKERAIKHNDKLPQELKASMQDLDAQIKSFGNKLEDFPKASNERQQAVAPQLKEDYKQLKESMGIE